jgi:hypothetical protein
LVGKDDATFTRSDGPERAPGTLKRCDRGSGRVCLSGPPACIVVNTVLVIAPWCSSANAHVWSDRWVEKHLSVRAWVLGPICCTSLLFSPSNHPLSQTRYWSPPIPNDDGNAVTNTGGPWVRVSRSCAPTTSKSVECLSKTIFEVNWTGKKNDSWEQPASTRPWILLLAVLASVS